MQLQLHVSCNVRDSFRVQQISGMFDVPPQRTLSERFAVELPDRDESWTIGAIVGPSGSGKTTVAREAFGPQMARPHRWSQQRAVIDQLGDRPIKELTSLLASVGFGSPPAWLKPYHVLSCGEQFRAGLARSFALATAGSHDGTSQRPLVVCDEFTSSVDRRTAKTASAALSKALRAGRIGCRFVAVTCHSDIVRWLQPDWVLDLSTRTLQRRRLRRPKLQLDLFRCDRAAWPLFAKHHYLTSGLGRGVRCFLGVCEGEPATFCATMPAIGRRGHWRITRLVTLPHWQGAGIGLRTAEAVAELHLQAGHRMSLTASHPAVLSHCTRSPRWQLLRVSPIGRRPKNFVGNYLGSPGRAVVSFEYVHP